MREKRVKKKRYGRYGDAALHQSNMLAVMLLLSLEIFFLDWNNIREAEAVMEQQNRQWVSEKSERKYCGQQEVDVVEESGQGQKGNRERSGGNHPIQVHKRLCPVKEGTAGYI